MESEIRPGPTAEPADLHAAQERNALRSSELPRVRSAATAWRNGLAGLLAALAGFGIIRGNEDIGRLGQHWKVAVGVLLFAALVAGAIGALSLLRAAHGRPAVMPVDSLPPQSVIDHTEAIATASALRRGITCTMICAALLAGAVAATWYGPPPAGPKLEVVTRGGTLCGTFIALAHSEVEVRTLSKTVPLAAAVVTAIRPSDKC